VAIKYTNVVGTMLNDVLKSTAANEAIVGGEGIDKLIFEEGTKGVVVNLKKGTIVDSYGKRDTVSGVEIVTGTSFNDRIVGSDDTDYLVGGGGDDYLHGGLGSDELYGGEGNDKLYGGQGNDFLVGGKGSDYINGGAGFDTADYSDEGGAGITVNLKAGTVIDTYGNTDTLVSIERIRATDYDDNLVGSNAANVFEAGGGNDHLDGGNGNDTLLAGFGNDTVLGGNGNDILVGGRGADMLDGGKGKDTVDYSQDAGWRAVAVNLATGLGEDSWGDSDILTGIENVTGGDLGDWIHGDGFSNVLNGGAGDDILTGGGGNDVFAFGAGHGHDQINDFNAGDQLNLAALGFNSVDDVLAVAQGHELGAMIVTGEGSSIVLVDVNVNDLGSLGYIFS
jgi:Ca2+-binding RTX toxin-like protein